MLCVIVRQQMILFSFYRGRSIVWNLMLSICFKKIILLWYGNLNPLKIDAFNFICKKTSASKTEHMLKLYIVHGHTNQLIWVKSVLLMDGTGRNTISQSALKVRIFDIIASLCVLFINGCDVLCYDLQIVTSRNESKSMR